MPQIANPDHILVTGAAGFIGSSLCEVLVAQGRRVTGIDNFSPNYSQSAKRANLCRLFQSGDFAMVECDVGSIEFRSVLLARRPDLIVHLAATPGVRPSVNHVLEYVDNNVRATANVLTSAASVGVPKIVFGSSSSVYGMGCGRPAQEDDPLAPLSPYGATKLAGEALCRAFVASHDLSITCLRFFSVFGPRQRPDMAIYKLAHCIYSGVPFPMSGDGKSARDYTYISDIVAGICASFTSESPYEVFNLGSNNPIHLETVIKLTSEVFQKPAILQRVELASCEPLQTCANITRAKLLLGYRSCVDFQTGIDKFAEWYVASQAGEKRCETLCM